jgi:type I restriction enzyme S subunit
MKNNNNNLPKGWRKVKLGEILKEPPQYGYTASATNKKVGPKFLRVTDIVGYKVDWAKVPFCKISEKEKKKYLLNKGDIVFARAGTVGYTFFAKENPPEETIFASYLIRIKIDEKRYDPVYVSYFLKSPLYWGQVNNFLTGTSQPGINATSLKDFELLIPQDINEQKRIADILSAFDDKIELNNKIIKTLEEMAQEVFKEWFNENSKFKSQKSKLEEWEIGYLGNGIYSEIIKPKVKKFEGEKIYLATADVEKNEIINEKTKISYDNRPIRANMEPVLNSIWFAKMINTYKVLFFFEGNKENIEKYILSTGFMGIKALKNMQYYLYLFINSEKFHRIKDTLVQGAVQEAITNTNVKQIKFLVPPTDLINKFNEKVEPLLIKAYRLKKENQTLAKLRDLLLPKLMSGEIRV